MKELRELSLASKLIPKKRDEISKNSITEKNTRKSTSEVWKTFCLLLNIKTHETVKGWAQCILYEEFVKYNGVTTSGTLDLTINTEKLSAKVFNSQPGPDEKENEDKINENVIFDAANVYENIEYLEFEDIDASAAVDSFQINIEDMQSANDEEIFEPHQTKRVGRKKQRPQQCLECGKILPTKYLLDQHVQRYHNSPTLMCPVGGCSGIFYLRKHVIQHLQKKHKMDLQAANIMERGLSK